MAARLGSGLAALSGARLLHPVDGNEVFVELSESAIARLAAAGFGFYRWGETPVLRLVTAFDTASEAVESFLRVARDALGSATKA
jgi:threonine aldolase